MSKRTRTFTDSVKSCSTGTVPLRSRLIHEPRPLRFGTSGRRGQLIFLTHLEIYVNVLGELRYLQSKPVGDGGLVIGDPFYFARDLRPSSPSLCQAVCQAVTDAGMVPVYLGCIPTPALAGYAFARAKGSIMVTGSHIPFDRNGYKLNTSRGELMKQDEVPIDRAVAGVREEIYAAPFDSSPFDENGALRRPPALPEPDNAARDEYLSRYLDFFAGQSLEGLRVLVYQHSAVGRDLLTNLLRSLGAEVVPAGRSETFVPIDTEAIDAETLSGIRALLPDPDFDAVVSTDGDSDRPLILGVDRATGALSFFPGDLVGMVVADYLGADAVVVPISCNDAIDRGPLAAALEPKTRIGSPYVIAGMQDAARKGRSVVCGWEANGGFLLGSDIRYSGKLLRALATRDAFLPILAVLFAAREQDFSLAALFGALPARFTFATLIRNFPRASGVKLAETLEPAALEPLFGPVASVDRTDGPRITFASGDVIHFRPSGNADEFRIYACAGSPERAAAIAAEGAAWVRGLQ
jgi:phosphomannomutase